MCNTQTHVSIQSLQRLALFAAAQGKSIDLVIDELIRQETPESDAGRYRVEILGHVVAANTLASWLSRIADHVDSRWPEALSELATMRTRRGDHISRRRDLVHIGRPDLPVAETESGWFISANISYSQARSWISALCDAAGWTLGSDVKILK